MAPAQINTTKPFPAPRRTSSESSSSPSMSALSSPTSPTATTPLPSAASTDSSASFFARIRSSRSRSPARRHTTSAVTSPLASPATPAMSVGAKRPSAEHPRLDSTATVATMATLPPRPRTQKRNSGTTMQCGRHSNDWLFGGFSITDTVKDLLHRADEDSK